MEGLLRRVAGVENRKDPAEWLERHLQLQESSLEKLRTLELEPLTDERIEALIAEARSRFEARKQNLRDRAGPEAHGMNVYEELLKIAQAPDPRAFDSAEAYAEAEGAWLRGARFKKGKIPVAAEPATSAGRTADDPPDGRQP